MRTRDSNPLCLVFELLVNLFAGWTNGKLLRRPIWDPNLSAKRNDSVAHDSGLDDLVFLDVVRVALVIAIFNELFFN